MRNYLKEIEIVGVVLCYQEGEMCRWSLDWLYANCDRVLIVLDNWNEETENIVVEYKNKYPDITSISYSDIPFCQDRNLIQGEIKRRFKGHQTKIRDFAIAEVKKLHEQKPIDLLIWPDSDETMINEFPKYLENFWYNYKNKTYMTLGFVQVYDNFRTIYNPKMSPHARVFRYTPEMNADRGKRHCVYYPYSTQSAYSIKNVLVHIPALTEEYRKKREFFDNQNGWTFERGMLHSNGTISILPKDVRTMTAEEIKYYNQKPSEYKQIPFSEFIKNKESYYA